jgi:DNA-binding FadR family transcriptional regulator
MTTRPTGSARARETVSQLQAAIRSGRWPVNSQIPTEAELATELGVGRSTVREAVRSLAHLGMLEPAPGRGTFVRSLNPVRGVLSDFAAEHSWADILTVRRALEVQAAALAAHRGDAAGIERLREACRLGRSVSGGSRPSQGPGQFHATLIDLADNQLLAELYSGLIGALRSGLESGAVCHGLAVEVREREHEAMVAAIAAGNATAAAALAAAHADHDLTVPPA